DEVVPRVMESRVMSGSQPTFLTARLSIRPAGADDLDALHALWSDARVRRFLFDDQAISRELAKSALDGCLEHAVRGLGLWLVFETEGAGLLGCVGLNPTTVAAAYEPALSGLLEPLAAFAPRHWHKGYARESLRPVLGHAFGSLGQTRVA